MSLKPESRWSATLIQLTTLVVVVFGGGWFTREVKADMDAVKAEISAINRKLDTQYVTWNQARLIAGDVRIMNPGFSVPNLNDYREKDNFRQ